MSKRGEKILVAIIAGLVVGVLLWIFEFGGKDHLKLLFRRPKIEAYSIPRNAKDKFLADERVRFCLKNVRSERVFWLFDEKDIDCGDVEKDHAFPYEDSKEYGIECDHRVDAFYKRDGSYRTISTHVRVENIKYNVKFDIGPSRVPLISLRSDATLGSRWVVAGASLGKFEGGIFKLKVPLELYLLEAKSGPGTITSLISQEEFIRALAYPKGSDIKTQLITKRDVWVIFELLDRYGKEELAIAKPLHTALK